MRRLAGSPDAPEVTIELDGTPLSARAGEPVASALLAAGETIFSRSVKYHRPRGPFCLAAACSHCLMRVDGVPNQYTCQVPVRAGMRIERQNAYPSATFDVFAATDWVFYKGLDHHELFAGVPVAEKVMAKVARQLAGLGKLPEAPAAPTAPAESLRARVAIVGGGAAGLGAALALAEAQVPFVLVERAPVLGGRLVRGAPSASDPSVPALPPSSVRTRATAFALYRDEKGPFLAVSQPHERSPLLKLHADHYVLAPGGHPPMVPFENNDLPGVFAGRAVSALIRRDRLLPGKRFALAGEGPELDHLAALLRAHGGEVAVVLDRRQERPGVVHGEAFKAHGRGHVSGLTYQRADGSRERVDCDAIALCVPVSPSYELARHAGVTVAFDEKSRLLVPQADADGRTSVPFIRVAGEVVGPLEARDAFEQGRRVGAGLARELSPGGAP